MSDLQDAKESLGSYLKRNREDRNISVEQVAYATRISLKMLRALEEDDHTALPASTFVRGYLQAYAKYVRLDTQDLLLRYQHHLATAPDTKKNSIRSHYLYVRERYQEKRRLVLIIVLFATMLSVAGTYFMLKAKREKNKRLAQTAEQIQRQSESQAQNNGLINVKEPEKDESGEKIAAVAPAKKEEPVSEKAIEKKAEKPAEAVPVKPEKKEAIVAPAPVPVKAPEAKPAEVKQPEPKPIEAKQPEAKPAEAKVEAKAEAKVDAAKPTEAKSTQKKAYNLLIKSNDVDVWFRFQADDGEAKNIVLKAGKAIVLRADKVIKVFSGNLGALRATQDGKEVTLRSEAKSKSFVWPLSEAANYPLPLFPDIQNAKKPEPKKESEAPKSDSTQSEKPANP